MPLLNGVQAILLKLGVKIRQLMPSFIRNCVKTFVRLNLREEQCYFTDTDCKLD